MSRPAGIASVLASTLFMSACVSETSGPERADHASITIRASSAAHVEGIAVEVSAPDIVPSLLINLTRNPGSSEWTGSLQIPVGNARLFQGRAYDAQGTLTHEGSTTADIQAGPNPPLTLSLQPLTGQPGDVPIEVTVVDRSVEISPEVAVMNAGTTLQFSATITGPSCTPLWASSNPGIAVVDASGLVTASTVGNVRIVLSCGGVAAAAEVTVE